MDYDSPRFIAAVKRILRDGTAHLADSLNDLNDAVHAHWQTDAQSYQTKPVSVTDLCTDVPISVKTYAQRSPKERVWGFTKGVLEIAVAIAVITYAVVSYEQWQELAKANDVAMSNFRRARIDANGQLKQSMTQTELARGNFLIDERAWIGVVAASHINPTTQGIAFTSDVVNTGKTPGFITEFLTNAKFFDGDLAELPDKPQYDNPHGIFHGRMPIFPGGREKSAIGPSYTQDMINEVMLHQKTLTYYGIVRYTDVFKQQHFTTFCYHYDWSPPTGANMANCKRYNGTDDPEQKR